MKIFYIHAYLLVRDVDGVARLPSDVLQPQEDALGQRPRHGGGRQHLARDTTGRNSAFFAIQFAHLYCVFWGNTKATFGTGLL